MKTDRLNKQIEFITEIDKLKSVFRKAYLIDASRNENSAEHSWHVTLSSMILKEYCSDEVDLLKVIKILLIHDIVEVDAGDTGIYDVMAAQDKSERESLAADRIFNLLPTGQNQEIYQLWAEFEQGLSAEAKFAGAVDRLMPLLHNYLTQGKRWKEDGITYQQVVNVCRTIQDGSQELWEFALTLINESVSKGYLPRG